MGGGALPLPMPTQPETLTATRVATKATSTFFIGVPLSFTPRDSHFVPRCTVSRPLNPMVHRLRRQGGTSKGTVSLGTQLPSRPVAMCLWAGGWHVDGKQLAAVFRIKALWRLLCCALPVLCSGGAGVSGKAGRSRSAGPATAPPSTTIDNSSVVSFELKRSLHLPPSIRT